MNAIRPLTRKDMYSFAVIGAGAYAGMKVTGEEDIRKLGERLWKIERADPGIHLYGLFRGGRLVGGMRLFDFSMKMLSAYIPVGGVGFIAVDLEHKREHVCKDLVEFYIDHYAKKKAPMLVLYPFRPDFYRRMGFGYGTKVNEYRINPSDLPFSGERARVSLIGPKDFTALDDCYHRVVDRTHGMIKRTKTYMNYLARPGVRIAAFRKGKKIMGFMAFTLTPSDEKNWLVTEMRTLEFIFETREAMMGLLAFVNSQADQVKTLVLRLQDDDFHLVPRDPRNDSGRLINPVGHETNTSGVGIMYRVIDTPGLFRALK
jgi:predicted acetyltransferase